MYTDQISWPSNVRLLEHVAPPEHGQFYSSSPLMLNITRQSMAQSGYCPSGRLFESAACGTAVLSDTEDAMRALRHDRGLLKQIGARARERALDCHTADLRAKTLINLLERASTREPAREFNVAQEVSAGSRI